MFGKPLKSGGNQQVHFSILLKVAKCDEFERWRDRNAQHDGGRLCGLPVCFPEQWPLVGRRHLQAGAINKRLIERLIARR